MAAPRGRRLGTAPLALVALALAACGSTAHVVEPTAAGARIPAESPADGTASEPGLDRSGAPVHAVAPVAIDHGGATEARRPATPPGSTPSGGETGPQTGSGWDDATVRIGVITQKDAEQVFGSFGFSGVDPGDTEAQARVLADEINARGGILGRRVELVFRDQPTLATAQEPNAAGAAACTDFTQDRPVVAVINIVTVMDYPAFRGCLADAGVLLFSASLKTVDDQAGADMAPYFHQSNAVSWDALAPVLVRRLQAQGWFTGWDTRAGAPGPAPVKVGVVVDGTDVGTRVAKVITSALERVGAKDTVVFQYAQASDGQNATVLQFAGRGVTHVIVADVELFAFQNSAAGQSYRPRYGIHTYNAPQNNLETFAVPGQNNGAVGVGWAPALDVSDANDPGDYSAGVRACRERMEAGGQQLRGKRLASSYMFVICDAMLLIEQGAAAAGSLDPAAISDGMVRLAPQFSAAIGFSTALAPTKRFVPGAARDLVWHDDCSCFRYARTETPL